MDQLDTLFTSPLWTLIGIVGAALILWWWVKNLYKTATDSAHRTPNALFRTFIWGRPMIYIIVGGIPILILLALSFFILNV